MVWSLETSQGFESDKIAAFIVPYTRGRGLDLGCGMRKAWPHFIGIDNKHHFGQHTAADIEGNGLDLSLFADNSLDFVFSSHMLEHVADYKAALREWWRVIKPGGNLVLYLPHKEFYPNIGEPGANPDHKHDFLPSDIVTAMREIAPAWEMLENEERNGSNEYSFFQVYQKREEPGHWFDVWKRNPSEGGKDLQRALVIRYGAIGDQIIASSILPQLKAQGYHVTYSSTPEAKAVLEQDPHIDAWLLQDKDQVPNAQLGPYWQTLAQRYDKIVNLCESMEGQLLALPDRLTYHYSHNARHKLYNRNYLEFTHDIADVPHVFAPRFYLREAEEKAVAAIKAEINAPVVCWAINGSSPHKIYPFTQVVLAWLMQRTPVHVFLLADENQGRVLQEALIEHLKNEGYDTSRIHGKAGEWSVRQALAFACRSDCVVGPETGVLNAAAFEDMPKVIYLSHSSEENLTKHWKNTQALTPDAKACPCYPCHRLHYTWEHCHQVEETSAALCASAIAPERIFEAIVRAFAQTERQAA